MKKPPDDFSPQLLESPLAALFGKKKKIGCLLRPQALWIRENPFHYAVFKFLITESMSIKKKWGLGGCCFTSLSLGWFVTQQEIAVILSYFSHFVQNLYPLCKYLFKKCTSFSLPHLHPCRRGLSQGSNALSTPIALGASMCMGE